jgi:hypothetical protein
MLQKLSLQTNSFGPACKFFGLHFSPALQRASYSTTRKSAYPLVSLMHVVRTVPSLPSEDFRRPLAVGAGPKIFEGAGKTRPGRRWSCSQCCTLNGARRQLCSENALQLSVPEIVSVHALKIVPWTPCQYEEIVTRCTRTAIQAIQSSSRLV